MGYLMNFNTIINVDSLKGRSRYLQLYWFNLLL
jgi:hypothetical protein